MRKTSLIESRLKETILDFMITIQLFDSLQTDELKIVAGYMTFIEIKAGEILFKEGDRGDYVCFVVEGVLDVVKESYQGNQVVIASLPKGRSIGEMAIIDNTPRSATIRAQTDATLIIMNQKRFDEILENNPRIGIKILKGISRLLSFNMRKTSSRLADYMLPVS